MGKTEQEEFWAGDFGTEYTKRNQSAGLLASNIHFFGKILSRTGPINTVMELGSNVGMNLKALHTLLPQAQLAGVEINRSAAEELRSWRHAEVYNQSILEFETDSVYDFVFTKGVMIHLNPEFLTQVYAKMYHLSKRYIMVAEYYNPAPVGITYRGHQEKLFKRDFSGELHDAHPDLNLIDYGFAYHRDPNFPQDDLTWFLFEKA